MVETIFHIGMLGGVWVGIFVMKIFNKNRDEGMKEQARIRVAEMKEAREAREQAREEARERHEENMLALKALIERTA